MSLGENLTSWKKGPVIYTDLCLKQVFENSMHATMHAAARLWIVCVKMLDISQKCSYVHPPLSGRSKQ